MTTFLLWVLDLAMLALGVYALVRLSRNTSKWLKFVSFVAALLLLVLGIVLFWALAT